MGRVNVVELRRCGAGAGGEEARGEEEEEEQGCGVDLGVSVSVSACVADSAAATAAVFCRLLTRRFIVRARLCCRLDPGHKRDTTW